MAILNIRNIDPEAAARIKLAAASRGWTLAVYLSRLQELHAHLLTSGQRDIQALLKSLGLERRTQ